MSEERRETTYGRIAACCDLVGYSYTAISPRDLSEGMLRRRKYNLNEIAHDTTENIIRRVLAAGANITKVFYSIL
jgi:ribonuclease H2 subunit A